MCHTNIKSITSFTFKARRWCNYYNYYRNLLKSCFYVSINIATRPIYNNSFSKHCCSSMKPKQGDLHLCQTTTTFYFFHLREKKKKLLKLHQHFWKVHRRKDIVQDREIPRSKGCAYRRMSVVGVAHTHSIFLGISLHLKTVRCCEGPMHLLSFYNLPVTQQPSLYNALH